MAERKRVKRRGFYQTNGMSCRDGNGCRRRGGGFPNDNINNGEAEFQRSWCSVGISEDQGVRPKKSLGQHFLTDMNIAQRIGNALSENGLRDVLEVGCGTGVLTQFLLKRNDIDLYGAEVDEESIAYLHDHFPEFTPHLFECDFLRMNLRDMFPGGVRIAGNFPYNISSQIFFKVLENRDIVPEVVGMVQREVALRIASKEGCKDYGILSVLLQSWYDIEYLFTVNEGVFNPPPKVKSAVVRLKRNSVQNLGCDEELFVKVVKAVFNQRRKTIRNSLKAVFGEMAGESRFHGLRPEQLSVGDFIELTLWVQDMLRY